VEFHSDSFSDEVEEDNMEEIDQNNILPDGRRTRGKAIDFAKAAEDLDKDGIADEDDEDDEDFESHDDSMHDE